MSRPTPRRLVLLAVNAGLAGLAGLMAMQSPPILPEVPPRAIEAAGAVPVAQAGAADEAPLASDPFGGADQGADRAPPQPADPAASAAPPPISLVGTGLGEDSFAAFRDSAGGFLRLRQGGAAEGWTLEAIRRNEVVVSDATSRWRLFFPPGAPAPCGNPACVGPP